MQNVMPTFRKITIAANRKQKYRARWAQIVRIAP
jgi:hypothetical protein